MELWMLILCILPTFVTTITISPNGNSPETKMIGGMMVDTQKRSTDTVVKYKTLQKNHAKTHHFLPTNFTKLAINERYRRLIPYMTFYYANDLVSPTTEAYSDNNVEVEKAKIVEAGTITPNERHPKIIYTPRHKNVPRYQGNRLTQFNIASANPTKLLYKDILPVLYQNPTKISSGRTPATLDQNVYENRDIVYDHYIPKQIKAPSAPFSAPTRKPFLNLYQNEEYLPNVQYFSDQNGTPKYKLIPYEQTPPIKNPSKQHYSAPAVIQKESVYIKPRPSLHPQPFYINQQQVQTRKPPATISEIYYERRPPVSALVEPVVESGFKPIVNSVVQTTETPVYSSTQRDFEGPYQNFKTEKPQEVHVIESVTIAPEDRTLKPQYVVEQPVYKQHTDSVTLAELLNSLQINKSIPKPITRENVSASIRTLLQVLNTLKATDKQSEVETVVSTPKPFENSEVSVKAANPISSTTSQPEDLYEEPYLAPIHTPSQHLDDYPTGGGSTQRFPLPVTSDEEGGTPGRPGIDYPILTVIPPTKFDCKTQRYKGFFADTETRCQVWHYCDLNGGQASFLCPNGTIFSQAALTCDWWFNVKCASTAQLYVLNESLYKYILPHSPKFPEDYSGPLVDKYLTLKFKEMEEQFKKNKNKKVASEKMDTDEESNSKETTEKDSSIEENFSYDKTLVNQADVIVESSGNSGNVQRLQDE